MYFVPLVVFALISVGTGAVSEPIKRDVELKSELIGVLGLLMAESTEPVFELCLAARVDEKGEGEGTLVLDPTGLPVYDEFGFPGIAPAVPVVKLDCSFKLVKTTVKVYSSLRQGAPESERREFKNEWRLYSITGPKITSRLFLSMNMSRHWVDGRFLEQGINGKVKHVVDLRMPPLHEPCHPGCFPAGTQITVPDGTRAIGAVGIGNTVTTVNTEGLPSQSKVAAVFVTRNRLIEVRTDSGTLTTTSTQPLSLALGGLQAAGALKPGDRIHTWNGLKRLEVAVREVTATDRETEVFNLILGDSTLFVADGFLARSKPRAPAEDHIKP